MKSKLNPIKFLSIICLAISCNSRNKNVIGYVDKDPITYNDIDCKIQQELFDALNNIYLMRKIALDDLIKQKLIDEEAKKSKFQKIVF